jgi:hypothetical protein
MNILEKVDSFRQRIKGFYMDYQFLNIKKKHSPREARWLL